MSDNDRPGPVLLKLPQMADLPRPPLGALRWILLGLVLLFAALTTYFQLAPYEQGVVLRFGRHVRTVGSGPHLKLPFGIEQVYRVETEKQHKLEFGFRTKEAAQRTTYEKEGFGEESSMLTGDLNIADVEWVVQYRIDDPYKFLFELRDPVETIRVVAEAEMRGVVGDMGFNEVIKSKRAEIEELVRTRMNEILRTYEAGVDVKIVQLQDVHPPAPVKDSFEEVNRALQEMERSVNEVLTVGRQEVASLVERQLQALCNEYQTGIKVEQVVLQNVNPPAKVKPSFNAVNQAQQEREERINTAQREYNQVVPRARGEAQQNLEQAEGYRIDRVNRAQGDAARFAALYEEYRKAPEVTRKRIYLETLGRVLPKTGKKVVVDPEIKGLLPLFNLNSGLNGGLNGGGPVPAPEDGGD